MAVSIEELRREKDRIEREREEIERRLVDAERREREQVALTLLPQVLELTARIDALKQERHDLLGGIREAAPHVGDFTYAAEDYRLTLAAVRQTLKQPDLLDRLMTGLTQAHVHVEPRAPKFRLFRDLHAIGTLHVGSRRVSVAAVGAILDAELLREGQEINTRYPGLVVIELASEKRERRVREGVTGRLPDGDYALSMTFHASDTGTFDVVIPLALRALEQVAAHQTRLTRDEEARLFERWPVELTSVGETIN